MTVVPEGPRDEGAPPMSEASLCYVVQDDRVLLIRKKRGVGAGKINGPGGKVEPGESMLESAVRETREEIGVTPLDLEQRGELTFDFVGAKVVRCGVFIAPRFEGEPIETDEAVPVWHATAALPYDEMWDDDREWLPLLLAGKCFRGSVRIEPGDQVHEIRVAEISRAEL
jgi:8-oxo-dGTP diphosphatase